jgi:hypothetical protein
LKGEKNETINFDFMVYTAFFVCLCRPPPGAKNESCVSQINATQQPPKLITGTVCIGQLIYVYILVQNGQGGYNISMHPKQNGWVSCQ